MAAPTTVETRYGKVRGQEHEGLLIWRGVRYAASPAGSARWLPPAAPEPWSGTAEAIDFPTRAPQILTPELVPPGGASPSDDGAPFGEDCLFVNITAPVVDDGRSLPVLVWFHGGGFVWGSGANFIGDGTAIAERGVVVVTVNYRLGSLGFLRLDHLLGDRYASSCNAGLLDQIAALRWVQDNISGFGGDPRQVTIGGVSAGAKSVANLMATPAAAGSFRGSIMQSGGDHVASPETSAQVIRALLSALGLAPEQAPQLLKIPAVDLLDAQQSLATGVQATWLWRPTVDGIILPSTPTQALAGGAARGIALMAGITANEAGSYDLADPTAAEQAPRILREIFAEDADAVVETYRSSRPHATDRELYRQILSDERYGIPTQRLLEAHATHADCWRYRFDAPTPGAAPDRWGFHGADVPFVWDIGMEKAEHDLQALAESMRSSWVNFIHTGDPAAHGLPPWPRYNTTERPTMILDRDPHIEQDPYPGERQAWEAAQWEPGTWWPLLTAPALPLP